MKRKAEPTEPPTKEAFERFDQLFTGVVSVSNKRVRERMAEEKRKRAAVKKPRARP